MKINSSFLKISSSSNSSSLPRIFASSSSHFRLFSSSAKRSSSFEFKFEDLFVSSNIKMHYTCSIIIVTVPRRNQTTPVKLAHRKSVAPRPVF